MQHLHTYIYFTEVRTNIYHTIMDHLPQKKLESPKKNYFSLSDFALLVLGILTIIIVLGSINIT